MDKSRLLKLKIAERDSVLQSAQNCAIFLHDGALGDAYIEAINKLNIEILELEKEVNGKDISNKEK